MIDGRREYLRRRIPEGIGKQMKQSDRIAAARNRDPQPRRFSNPGPESGQKSAVADRQRHPKADISVSASATETDDGNRVETSPSVMQA